MSKFAGDTTILGLVTNDDEPAYRQEVLVSWCYDNNLCLNISKTKEMIVDCGKLQEATRSLLRGSASSVVCTFLVVHKEKVVRKGGSNCPLLLF